MTFQTVRSLPTDLLVPTLRARQAHALALPLHYQMTLLWPDLQKKMGAVLCTTYYYCKIHDSDKPYLEKYNDVKSLFPLPNGINL